MAAVDKHDMGNQRLHQDMGYLAFVRHIKSGSGLRVALDDIIIGI